MTAFVAERRGPDKIGAALPFYLHKQARKIQGAHWDKSSEVFEWPLHWTTCIELRHLFGEGVEAGPELAAWSWEERKRLDVIEAAHTLALDPTADVEGDPRLRPFQRTAVQWLRLVGDAILGDDMGTGKTVMLSSVIADVPGPHLVIAPKGALRPWADHLVMWSRLDDVPLQPYIVAGSADKRRKTLARAFENDHALGNLALVMTLDTLKQHTRYAQYGQTALVRCSECGGLDEKVRATTCEVHPRELSEVRWGSVVIDEAHKIREPSTKQTRAVWWVSHHAERKLAATGTPIDATPDEFWSLLFNIEPGVWPSRSKYVAAWLDVTRNFWGGEEVSQIKPDRAQQFHELKNHRFLRRPKELVLPHLPRREHSYRYVTMSPKQSSTYRKLAEGMLAEVDGGTVMTFNPLSHGIRLGQAAAATLTMNDADEVRLSEPSSKLDELEDVLEEAGSQAVGCLFASRQLLDLMATRLDKAKTPFARVVGGMSATEIEEQKDAFNSGRANVMLLLLGAGAEALSFTRGSLVVFVDESWQQLHNTQGVDRWHGIGRGDESAERLSIVHLITQGTVEEYKHLALVDKGNGFEDLVRDRETLRLALAWRGTKQYGEL